MKKIILISLIILNLGLSSFSFAQDTTIEVPESFEEAQQIGEQALDVGKEKLPDIIKEIWREKVLPVWQKMYDWFYENIWLKIKGFFSREVEPRVEQEIEIRKEIVDQEFEQEKEEVKKDLPKFLNSIWNFIRDIVQKLKILWE